MMPALLVVEDLSKSYVVYASELQRFARWFGIPVTPVEQHLVLQHVTFRVGQGEAVGIVGQNGAGKSTLLKIIAGTTKQSTGRVTIGGRVSALLELGLGFNPELSGRENAHHAAGLIGAERHGIDALVAEIEKFAEIGEYFDQPLRTYSSGMQMRVAFSVATAVRPDLLIVDEALAVGDAYFVHKCFKRIREYREKGTTLLIVSHDPAAIQSLCDRAILIDGGRLIRDGAPSEVLDYYNALVAAKENDKIVTERDGEGRAATRSGTGEATVSRLEMRDRSGQAVEYIGVGDEVALCARVDVNMRVDQLVFGYMIRDRLGQPIFGTNTFHTGQIRRELEAGDRIDFTARFPANLGPGTYSVSVALSSTETHLVRNYEWRDLALVFTVANSSHPEFVGSNWIPPMIAIEGAGEGREGAGGRI